MSKDNLNTLFENMKDGFDIEVPNPGHKLRFLDKLKQQHSIADQSTSSRNLWKPFLGIAASIALILSLTFGLQGSDEIKDLASISPEMENTQTFFTNAIATELEKLQQETSPEFKQLVDDALVQIERLETEYQKLKVDLTNSGEDKRVIYAMISNFQNRIDLLEHVLQQIEEIKLDLKNNNNENISTL